MQVDLDFAKDAYTSYIDADPVGRTYVTDDAVYRIIKKEAYAECLELLHSRLFKELVSREYFPKTEIFRHDPEKSYLVLKHDRAPFILYPGEWTFSMLKDAALRYLDVMQLCHDHGYGLKDGHAYNIVFFHTTPKFVDFGSIVKNGHSAVAEVEFFDTVAAPLFLWSKKEFWLANLLLSSDLAQYLPVVDRGASFVFRRVSSLRKNISEKNFWFLCRVSNFVTLRLIGKALFKASVFDSNKMRRRIIRQKFPAVATEWMSYGKSLNANVLPRRFQSLIDWLSERQWHSLVDVAGNSGYVVSLLANRFSGIPMLSADYDSCAADEWYRKSVSIGGVGAGMLNVFARRDYGIPVHIRLKADVVLVLAVTHHLFLRQGYSAEKVFTTLDAICGKYLIVEFMPLGLWDGKIAPILPDWYSEEWFCGALRESFEIEKREQTEENRILFVCRKKAGK